MCQNTFLVEIEKSVPGPIPLINDGALSNCQPESFIDLYHPLSTLHHSTAQGFGIKPNDSLLKLDFVSFIKCYHWYLWQHSHVDDRL